MQLNALLRILPLIHLSMVMGLVLFTSVVYWHNPNFNTGMNSNDIFIYLVPVIAIIGYFASKSVFQNLLNTIARIGGIENKSGRYRRAAIIKYALLEGPAILALIGYYLKGNMLHLVIALCLIIYLFSQRPTRKRVIEDLKLTLEDQKELELKN